MAAGRSVLRKTVPEVLHKDLGQRPYIFIFTETFVGLACHEFAIIYWRARWYNSASSRNPLKPIILQDSFYMLARAPKKNLLSLFNCQAGAKHTPNILKITFQLFLY